MSFYPAHINAPTRPADGSISRGRAMTMMYKVSIKIPSGPTGKERWRRIPGTWTKAQVAKIFACFQLDMGILLRVDEISPETEANP